MQGTGPLPRHVGHGLELVVVRKARHVRLEDRHARDVQSLSGEGSRATQHEGAGQVHYIGTEAAELGEHHGKWNADGQ